MLNFTDVQKKYLKQKKSLYRDKEGKQNYESILNYTSLSDIIQLINYFILDIKLLSENGYCEIGYCGKDFFLNYHSDNKKIVTYDTSFLPEDTLKQIISNVGSYLPILMFFDEDECITAIECIHTKHSLRAIKSLFEENILNKEKFLFIIKPSENFTNDKKGNIIIPKILFDKAGYLLNLQYEILDNNWVNVFSNNTADLWLLFKLFHKEASYHIAKNMEQLYKNNIFPSEYITKK